MKKKHLLNKISRLKDGIGIGFYIKLAEAQKENAENILSQFEWNMVGSALKDGFLTMKGNAKKVNNPNQNRQSESQQSIENQIMEILQAIQETKSD